VLYGGLGNDDLIGGAGSDHLYGGPGTNWCVGSGSDTQTGCVYDEQPAAADSPWLSVDQVDVTSAAAHFRARVHVTDDTGVTRVALYAPGSIYPAEAHLVSGTIRDGLWVADFEVKRWTPPATGVLAVRMDDRVGRYSYSEFPAATMTIVDRNPDTDAPVPYLLTPTPSSSYDVRTSSQDVVVKLHITDAVSGVDGALVVLYRPVEGGFREVDYGNAVRVSGDAHDGVWKAVIRIPSRTSGGDWNVQVNAYDRSNQSLWYDGPDLFAETGQPNPYYAALPDGRGRFTVIGVGDNNPPAISSVKVTPTQVDTLNQSQDVTVTVAANDIEGVEEATAWLFKCAQDGDNTYVPGINLHLASGTTIDGVWTGTITLPQGLPPGTYCISAGVSDTMHWRSYVSASAAAANPYQIPIASDPRVEVVQG